MTKPVKALNPFYPLLVMAGLAFAVTACAYGVMTVKMLDPAGVEQVAAQGPSLLQTLDQHGLMIMSIELGVLAVASFLAMATDNFWTRRAEAKQDPPVQ